MNNLAIGGALADLILRRFQPHVGGDESLADRKVDLALHFGDSLLPAIRGKRVIDFGCGVGREAVEMARHAAFVTGVDIQRARLKVATERAARAGVPNCTFVERTTDPADIITSKDAFEHFGNPLGVLRLMRGLLAPGGSIFASFGPTWFHPYGGHLFSVFPWAHLVLSEEALIRWRSRFKSDGATRFHEVEGGLNQMTIKRFEQLVREAGLRIEWMDTVPIKGLAVFRSRMLREFGSSLVRCRLVLAK